MWAGSLRASSPACAGEGNCVNAVKTMANTRGGAVSIRGAAAPFSWCKHQYLKYDPNGCLSGSPPVCRLEPRRSLHGMRRGNLVRGR
jgi:hypothetical protein